ITGTQRTVDNKFVVLIILNGKIIQENSILAKSYVVIYRLKIAVQWSNPKGNIVKFHLSQDHRGVRGTFCCKVDREIPGPFGNIPHGKSLDAFNIEMAQGKVKIKVAGIGGI